MRIDRLKIRNFKNLEDVDINFDEGSLETVVIGQNGSGKSNVIEAIATIFRDLDDARAAAKLQYELEYECKGHRIKIDIQPYRLQERRRAFVPCSASAGQ